VTAREAELQARMADASADHVQLAQLTSDLKDAGAKRERLEERWLEMSESL
jgi:hypothetical protein